MTYEDFLKAFIDENKSKVLRDRMFGGYDISKYDSDKLTDKCYEFISDKMNTEFPRPAINSLAFILLSIYIFYRMINHVVHNIPQY